MDRLTEMEAFATVVDQGGFTDAAKKMGISKSAVSKHVSSLEMLYKDEQKEISGSGNGPVDAVFSCISKVIEFEISEIKTGEKSVEQFIRDFT